MLLRVVTTPLTAPRGRSAADLATSPTCGKRIGVGGRVSGGFPRPLPGMHAVRAPAAPRRRVSREVRGMGVSGEPTAGLVPGVPVPALPDPARRTRRRPAGPAGSGTASRSDRTSEGARGGGGALAQALAPLARRTARGHPVCDLSRSSVPPPEAAGEAARQVMTASGARMTIGATAARRVRRRACRGPRPGRGGGGRPPCPVPACAPSRPDARLPALDGDERAAVLLVDPHTFAGFLPAHRALPVVGGLAAEAAPVDQPSSTARCMPTARSVDRGRRGIWPSNDDEDAAAGPPMTVTRAERNVLQAGRSAALVRLARGGEPAHPLARRRATARRAPRRRRRRVRRRRARVDFLVRGARGRRARRPARWSSATSWRWAGPCGSSCATPGTARWTRPPAQPG